MQLFIIIKEWENSCIYTPGKKKIQKYTWNTNWNFTLSNVPSQVERS